MQERGKAIGHFVKETTNDNGYSPNNLKNHNRKCYIIYQTTNISNGRRYQSGNVEE